MRLRAPRPSDWKDAAVWCAELEAHLKASDYSVYVAAAQAAPQASRLAVNPHLLCVVSFAEMSCVAGRHAGSQQHRVRRYRLELRGINQAGLLLWISLVLAQAGFNIVRAQVTTKDGDVHDTFELTTSSEEAEGKLRSHLHIPVGAEVHSNLPLLHRQWATEAEGAPPGAERSSVAASAALQSVEQHAHDGASDLSGASDQDSVASPAGDGASGSQRLSRRLLRSPFSPDSLSTLRPEDRCRVELSNGDVYEGAVSPSKDGGGVVKHGHGTYTYASPHPNTEYSGQWRTNSKHGFGFLLLRNGGAYAGQWLANLRHGVGVALDYGQRGASGPGDMPTHRYEGEWESDSQHGIGVEETEDRFLYCGRFANGQPSERGIRMPHRDPGVKGCRVLSEGSWRPLIPKNEKSHETEERYRVPAASSGSTPRGEGGAPRAPEASGPAAPGSRKAAGVSSPSLWDEVELAAVVYCLGVNPEAARMVRGRRLHGAKGLLELSNSGMARKMGLASPLERLVVRRTLQRLLWAEIQENGERGRSCCDGDVMAAPALSAHAIPMERLTIVSRIAQGGFGAVHRGALLPQGGSDGSGHGGEEKAQAVAVKEMMGDSRFKLNELLKEAQVMASLRHPNICRFIGVCADGRQRGKRYIVSELLDCSLFDLVHRPGTTDWNGVLDPLLAMRLAEGICAGLAYIHDVKHLVHADLKSSNILIDLSLARTRRGRPVPRICDFGHAAVRTAASPHDRLCTPHWAAPEVLRGEGLGPAADVYSMGVLLWEMLAKTIPHANLCFGQVIAVVGWAGVAPDNGLLPHVPDGLRSLMKDCLSFLPDERPSASQARGRLQKIPRRLRLQVLQMLAGFLACGNA
ncbi:unnamed protein product [Prorocentrum cordatum]|uniref:Non-specific protein-tyrosine kinase n=1 Tax=Prorocentrum cordatum TaxID=2364126 RepID=A0ABN9PFM1_9DINO|nr:unnamed protein product [Polarella glacialis]